MADDSQAQTLAAENPEALRELDLRYVSDAEPGFSRRRFGKGFSYRNGRGEPLRDPATLKWIRSLAIPPAWRRRVDLAASATAISWPPAATRGAASSTATIRAGARSATRPSSGGCWRSAGRCRASAPPSTAELARPGLGRRKVLATVVRLLETTLIRVGNDEYATANKTFGLTTMRDRHFKAEGAQLRFSFRGKSGKRARGDLAQPPPGRLVRRMQELPGQELFQYLDEDGRPEPIDSGEVNDYPARDRRRRLHRQGLPHLGRPRSWPPGRCSEFESFDSQAAAKRNVTQAIERVASRLGNTPAICRKSYVHPEIVGAYLDGSLVANLKAEIEEELRDELSGLEPEEVAVLIFLQRRLSMVGEAQAAA